MFRAAAKLFMGSFVGKISGVVRELLLAVLYGTSDTAGAVRAAQSATLIPVDFFTANSLASTFLPLYSKNSEFDDAKFRQTLLFWWTSLIMAVCTSIVLLGVFLWGREWVDFLVPGFSDEAKLTTLSILQVMAVGIPFYIFGNLLSYLGMANNEYTLASSRAAIQNLGMILGTVAAFYWSKPILMGYGFTMAYGYFCVLGIRRLIGGRWVGLPFGGSRKEWARCIKDFWKTIRPLLLLPIVFQGNVVVERVVSSLLGINVLAALGYAKLITETGILLIAMPLGMAGLSTVSKLNDQETYALLNKVVSLLLAVTLPLSFGLAANSQFIVRLMFEYGNFGSDSVNVTSSILIWLSFGFWCQVCSYFLMKVLSSKFRNKEVFVFVLISSLINVLVNFVFYENLGYSVLGISASLYAFFLLLFCSHALGIMRVMSKRVCMLLLAGAGYWFLVHSLPFWGIFLLDLLSSLFLFLMYWVLIFLSIPVLRGDAFRIISTLKRGSSAVR